MHAASEKAWARPGSRPVGSGQEHALAGTRVAVIGLGASGDAAARLALQRGASVYVTDSAGGRAVARRGAALRALGARVRLGGHDSDEVARAHTVVASPGIPSDAPVLRALDERGIDWISEPEFACRLTDSPLTVVTGTNGKTTTAALCAHILRGAGIDVALGGNVGTFLGPPASTLAALSPGPERIVLELSSFQLARIRELRPDVGVMTNLAVDHLDRYETVEDYHRDKRRLFEAGDAQSTWVLNGDDPRVMEMAAGRPGRHLTFSLTRPLAPGAWVAGGDLVWGSTGATPQRLATCSDIRLLGRHNVANALAALLAARASGADLADLSRSLCSFAALPHRLEPVGTVGGVLWVNDSKATNVAAAMSAVASLDGPLVLLLGGKDKGEDFGSLVSAMRGRCRAVVAFGEAGERASSQLRARARGELRVQLVAGSFAEAVAMGQSMARPGETLLLAPACSSFDMFQSYEARGDAFRALLAGTGS